MVEIFDTFSATKLLFLKEISLLNLGVCRFLFLVTLSEETYSFLSST